MIRLLRVFLDICLLRVGPQDLPYSWSLFGLALTGYAAIGVALVLSQAGAVVALIETVLDCMILVGLAWTALSLTGKSGRFLKTATALLGTGALLGLLAAPLVWQGSPDEPAQSLGWAGPLFLVLLVWSLLILGHILRHALEVTLGAGVGLGLAYTLLSAVVMDILFPAA